MSGKVDIADTQPDRLIKYRVSEDGFEAEVLVPGFWYTDFDKKIGGKLSYWAILKLHESIRWAAFKQGFADYPFLIYGSNYTLFVACSSYRLSEIFHDIEYKTHFLKNFPIQAKLLVSMIGKTSFTIACELSDEHGNNLSKHVFKAVLIDKQTRKPAAFPAKTVERYQNSRKPSPQYNISKIAAPNIPRSSFELKRTVLHSDCDMNFHANQVNFFKWCSDAAAEAAKAGHFSHFKKHPELYPLKFTEMHYLGEALVNTEVTTSIWEDERNAKCLRATVSSKEKVIFHAVMDYYEGPPVPVEPHLEAKL